jgi:hypothetical protein
LLDQLVSLKGIRRIFYGFITLFEFSLFSYFFYLNIKRPFFRQLIIAFGILFFVFISFYTHFAPFVRIDSIPIGIETILILLYSFYFLYEEMNNTNVLFLYNKYQFWIVIGFMIYLAGCFFMYIFANQLPQEMVEQYWFIIDIFLILKNLLFSIAILVFALSRNEKTPPRIPTLKVTT